ncbi:hypothetical protein DPMN_173509 [Dreissena polymorpha]|uniref:Uncharacterized protein n=1 Tax=Dreissena polymorpha TaxID=45954 RepID=A0A9D4E5L2_DREPO|nr:hypothetical protein DPMN_173509 [Dreissena polymorpha]
MKFHDDLAKHVTSRLPPGRHVFQRTGAIFELNSRILGKKITKFHEDLTKNKTSPPPGGHVVSPIWTILLLSDIVTYFEIDRGIIRTYFLTKFHEDRTRNVASTVFTNQMRTDGRTTDKDRYQKLI